MPAEPYRFIYCHVLFLTLCVNHGCLVNEGFWWQGSATQAALCPTVSAMATLGCRSGSLQDGAIVPSDLLSSQKGTPLLVHAMLPPNIGSPKGATTHCHPCFATMISVFCFCFLYLPSKGRGGGLPCCYT